MHKSCLNCSTRDVCIYTGTLHVKNTGFTTKNNIGKFENDLAKIDKMVDELVAKYCKYYHCVKDEE